MLSRLRISWLLFFSAWVSQASTLTGTIKLNQEGGGAAADVEVSATGANLVKTHGSGQFILEFPIKEPGDIVQLVLTKPGYVVVNWFQLRVTLPKSADAEPVVFLICKESEREEWARGFYRLKSVDAIEASYKRQVKELEEKSQQNAAAMARLRQERDQAKAQAEKAAIEFARLKPSEMTNLYAQAMSLFLRGKVEEALQVLDDNTLQQLASDARQRKQDAEKAEAEAVNDYLLKVHFFTTQFRFQQAEEVYKAAVQALQDSFRIHFAFGNFDHSLNRFPSAQTEYTRALELARRSGRQEDLALTLNNLGGLDEEQNRMDEARQHFEEALKTYRHLAQDNSAYLRHVASTLNNLATLDGEQNQPEESLRHFQEALTIYRRLPQQDLETGLPGLAATLNNLGKLEELQNRMQEARPHLDEALKTYRQLAQKNPETYQPDVAMALNNLGNLDRAQKHLEEARQRDDEALNIYRQMAQYNPETYLPGLAQMLNDLALLDADQKRLDDARQHYEEALKLYRGFAQQNFAAYCRKCMAHTLSNLALLDANQKRLDDARQHLEEALSVSRQLAEQSPEPYLPSIAAILNNLASVDVEQKRLEEARQHLEEALRISRQLGQQNPDAYLPEVAIKLENLALLYESQSRLDEARQYREDALKTYRQLAERSPNLYLSGVVAGLNKLIQLDLAQKRLDEARRHYDEALKILRQLAQQNPGVNLISVGLMLTGLAGLDEYQNRWEDARQHCEEALKIYRGLAQQNPATDRLGEALALKVLAQVDTQQDRWGQAIVDYSKAIQLSRDDAALLRGRGRVYFYLGQFSKAEKDFAGSISKEPANIYDGLWLYASQVHQGKDATAVLNKNSANFQLTKWPGQVVQLYLGILRKEDVLVAAENADSEKNNEQHCEAYFYLGEFALLKGDRPEAAHLFQKSIATGVQHFVEFSGANAELRRIRPN